MYNENKLRGKIAEKRIEIAELAKKIGINYVTLYRKMSGKTEFTRLEMAKIAEILNLTENEFIAIFFGEKLA